MKTKLIINLFIGILTILGSSIFSSCSNEQLITSENRFAEELSKCSYLEEIKIDDYVATTSTRGNKDEVSFSIINNDSCVLALTIVNELNNMFSVRETGKTDILFYVALDKEGTTDVVSYYDSNKQINQKCNYFISVDGKGALFIPVEIYPTNNTTTKVYSESMGDCYSRHMNSTTGRVVFVAYSRIFGLFGGAMTSAVAGLSCAIFRP